MCLSNDYDNIYFISKSLGTSIAGEISKIVGSERVSNMFLTPISYAIPYITNLKCTVIVGTNDKLFSKEEIKKISDFPSVDLHVINNATHSLEVDDYIESLEILRTVTDLCARFVNGK